MESYGFFDAKLVDGAYDREYVANTFASYFSTFIDNGVFPNQGSCLVVTQDTVTAMKVKIKTGKAFLKGYWYENTDELVMNLDVADGVQNRYDLIVIRLDFTERKIEAAVVKGKSAVSPTQPAITRNENVWEIALAKVYIKAGTVKIDNTMITDLRMNKDVCGLVCSTVEQLDATSFGLQLQGFIDEYTAKAGVEYNQLIDQFKAYVNELENVLDASDVGKIIAAITSLENKTNGLIDDTPSYCGLATGDGNVYKVSPTKMLLKGFKDGAEVSFKADKDSTGNASIKFDTNNCSVTRRCGIKILTGATSEDWILDKTSNPVVNVFSLGIEDIYRYSSGSAELICDKFAPNAIEYANLTAPSVKTSGGRLFLSVDKSIGDVVALRAWLASNNVTVIYRLMNQVVELLNLKKVLKLYPKGYLQFVYEKGTSKMFLDSVNGVNYYEEGTGTDLVRLTRDFEEICYSSKLRGSSMYLKDGTYSREWASGSVINSVGTKVSVKSSKTNSFSDVLGSCDQVDFTFSQALRSVNSDIYDEVNFQSEGDIYASGRNYKKIRKDNIYSVRFNEDNGNFILGSSGGDAEGDATEEYVVKGKTFMAEKGGDSILTGTLESLPKSANGFDGSEQTNSTNIAVGAHSQDDKSKLYVYLGIIQRRYTSAISWVRERVSTVLTNIGLTADKIKYGESFDGITGNFTGDGNISSEYILANRIGYAKGARYVGNIPVLTGIRNATGVAKWGDGGLAVYPEKGYQKGGPGDGEIKVSVSQIQSVNAWLRPDSILAGREIFGIIGTAQLVKVFKLTTIEQYVTVQPGFTPKAFIYLFSEFGNSDYDYCGCRWGSVNNDTTYFPTTTSTDFGRAWRSGGSTGTAWSNYNLNSYQTWDGTNLTFKKPGYTPDIGTDLSTRKNSRFLVIVLG